MNMVGVDALHRSDAVANKVCALFGRTEVRE
jgi:hypothetical protein